MIIQEDYEKASTLAATAADRLDLVQGMRSPRASDAHVTPEERNTWQAHFHLGTTDLSHVAEDRMQAKTTQMHRIETDY